jgi:acetylornithine deacetylase/succinyl-diaminopimelate desuccinylase-like protein
MRRIERAGCWFGLSVAALLAVAPVARAAPPHPGVAPTLSEAASWLQAYLRIDTTNPPGREDAAAIYLAAILQREGIAFQKWTSPTGRVSLVARLGSARSSGRGLVLLHHMDVVTPGPGWTAPPFAGLVRDGKLWGRGAVDDKSLGIAQLAALIELHRHPRELRKDVVFIAVPDEETGGDQGSRWLFAQHPELLTNADALLGEGGLNVVSGGQLRWWGIEVAQKRPLWLELRTSGRGGHGSGLNPESANHRMIKALDRLLQLPERWRVTPASRMYLGSIAPFHGDHWREIFTHLDSVIDEHKGPRTFLMPGMANLFLNTVQITVLSAGEKINVIPEESMARIDIRLLPDTDAADFLAAVKQALGKEVDIKVLITAGPSSPSPSSGEAWEAMRKTLSREGPVVPAFIAGFTDARFARERGIPAYGLSPFALAGEDLRGIHGPDEHIPISEFDRGVRRMMAIVGGFAGAAQPVKPGG